MNMFNYNSANTRITRGDEIDGCEGTLIYPN